MERTHDQDKQVLHEWRNNSPYWVKHSAILHSMLVPVTKALIEQAEIREGQHVLDIAGGAGEPALTIAREVGPTGRVMCTDAVPEMVTGASENAKGLGISNIDFRQCLADSLPFPDNSFDVVESRLGIMFFPEPLASIREMLRVLKPGGIVCMVVWHKSEVNPFCSIPSKIMGRHIETAPTDPDAPSAFRFAESGKLCGKLTEAGATNPKERLLDFHLEAAITPDEYWNFRSTTSGTLREQLRTLSHEQSEQIAMEVKDAIRPFFPAGRMRFPAMMLIVSGSKPL